MFKARVGFAPYFYIQVCARKCGACVGWHDKQVAGCA